MTGGNRFGLVLGLSTLLYLGTGCVHDAVTPASAQEQFTYLFLGHTYQWHSSHEDNRIDPRLEMHDYRQYDGLLLGGDLCSETTKFEHTVAYLDDIFNLSDQTCLWSVGNHDVRNGNLHYITRATGKPLFHAQGHHGISWLVLNTAIDDIPSPSDSCSLREEQVKLINAVFDTITPGQDLVVLLHHIVWGDVEPGMNTYPVANADRPWLSFACDSAMQFKLFLYPLLRSHAATGADIYVLSGDGGQYKKTYEYKTADGVTFLISGINNSVDTSRYMPPRPFSADPDSVLLIHNDRKNGHLSFEFIPLGE